MTQEKTSYGIAIRLAFEYLLEKYPEVFVIGQGLWSPWYVGNSMTDLDKKFGIDRVIDTPVSELACTGAAVGSAITGYRPIVIHPRMDFMLYAIDPIVNQAAKWHHMLGGKIPVPVTVRAIINRGGEQGAQHSQSLHSWFAHVPGLRVVMPASAQDARDLLIASVLSNDPVMYIDDRWLYHLEDTLPPVKEINLADVRPKKIHEGTDYTLVGSGYSTLVCSQAADDLKSSGTTCDVFDLRVINPLHADDIYASVIKTGRLCVVDGSWSNCGLAGEIIAKVVESVPPGTLKSKPIRINLPDAPAPTSSALENNYYPTKQTVIDKITSNFK